MSKRKKPEQDKTHPTPAPAPTLAPTTTQVSAATFTAITATTTTTFVAMTTTTTTILRPVLSPIIVPMLSSSVLDLVNLSLVSKELRRILKHTKFPHILDAFSSSDNYFTNETFKAICRDGFWKVTQIASRFAPSDILIPFPTVSAGLEVFIMNNLMNMLILNLKPLELCPNLHTLVIGSPWHGVTLSGAPKVPTVTLPGLQTLYCTNVVSSIVILHAPNLHTLYIKKTDKKFLYSHHLRLQNPLDLAMFPKLAQLFVRYTFDMGGGEEEEGSELVAVTAIDIRACTSTLTTLQVQTNTQFWGGVVGLKDCTQLSCLKLSPCRYQQHPLLKCSEKLTSLTFAPWGRTIDEEEEEYDVWPDWFYDCANLNNLELDLSSLDQKKFREIPLPAIMNFTKLKCIHSLVSILPNCLTDLCISDIHKPWEYNLQDDFASVFNKLERFEIIRTRGLHMYCDIAFPNLTELILNECPETDHFLFQAKYPEEEEEDEEKGAGGGVVGGETPSPPPSPPITTSTTRFPNLRKLVILNNLNLPSLEGIENFKTLRHVVLSECQTLKNITHILAVPNSKRLKHQERCSLTPSNHSPIARTLRKLLYVAALL